jgi:tetratricopeptide (TPR) repeat protein
LIRKHPLHRDFLPGLLIFVLALVLRGVCLWGFRDIPFFNHLIVDSKAYDAWGWRIAQGQILRGSAFYQAPLYPYLVGAFYAVFGHHPVWLRIAQVVLASMGCVVLARAAQAFFDRRTGITAGVMLALYAPAVFFDCLVQKSALDTVLLSFALLLVALADQRPGRRYAFFTGCLLGLLTLSRENALILIPVFAAWLAWRKSDSSPRARRAVPLIFGSCLVLLPVYVHHCYYGARTGITTNNAGTSFYIGNGSQADGSYVPVRPDRGTTELEESDARSEAEAAAHHALTPDQVSRYWFMRAVHDIGVDPVRWLRLLLRKAALAVNAAEVVDTDDIYFYEQFAPALRALNSIWNFGLLLPLALCGGVLTGWRTRAVSLLIICSAAMFATLIMFYVVGRYRHAMVPMLIPLAASALPQGASWFQSRRNGASTAFPRCRALIAVAVCVGALAIGHIPTIDRSAQLGTSYYNAAGAAWQEGANKTALQYYDLAIRAGHTDHATQLNRGALLAQMGRTEEAMAAYALAEKDGADPVLIAQNRGTALVTAGRFEDALQELEKADKLWRTTAELENSRGVALLQLQRVDTAKRAFETAIRLKPDYTNAYMHLIALYDPSSTNALQLQEQARRNGVALPR